MEVKAILAVTLLCVGIVHVQGNATGAPTDACGDLVPQHGTDPQKTKFPYKITTNVSKIKASEKVTVTISGDNANKFKGFIIQARIGDTPYGTFAPNSEAKLIDCGAGKKNTATHTNPSEKTSISLVWTAPAKLQGTVTFVVTVAKNGGVFWVRQKSSPVQVV